MTEAFFAESAAVQLRRAVIDTSSLVPQRWRRQLQQTAQAGRFVALWSPWVIAELNRVLTWGWLRRTNSDFSAANQRRCANAARAMMATLLPTFELVAPLPPYPPAWETLTDLWDQPIWAAAKAGQAEYVISENVRHFPPPGPAGRHVHEGIEYLSASDFLSRLVHQARA